MFEIGNSLREARLRQQLDFPGLEQAIKIRGKYLRALEDEQFELLPASTYVKGFLRAYADYLGLDGQLYVDEYNSRFVTGEEEQRPLGPRRSSVRPSANRRIETNVVLIALTAIVLVTVFVFAAWKFGGSPNPSVPAVTPTSPVEQSAARSKAHVRTRPVRTSHAAAPATRLVKAKLTVTAARGNCWLEVHAGSATGALLYQGTLERGQSQRFVARRLWINAGAPENLSLRVNGREAAFPRNTTPRVLIVTAAGVAPAPPVA